MEITYDEFIQSILDGRGRFSCGDQYHERHHIIPKCMGGTNDNNNLIDLLAREHFEAHRLLALENPDNEKLVYAWWCMCNVISKTTKERYSVTAEEYEEAKIVFSNTRKELFKNPENHPWFGKHHTEESKRKNSESHKGKRHTDETRKKWSESRKGEGNSNYGNCWTEEQKKKQSEKMKGKFVGENNPMYGVHRFGKDSPRFGKKFTEEQRKKMSESHKGRIVSDETRKKLSKANSGENNSNFGNYWTDEQRKKLSEKMKGRYVGANGAHVRKVIRLSDLKIYDCGICAAEDNNVSKSTICNRCKTHKGFMYYDEWIAQQNDLKNNKNIKEN